MNALETQTQFQILAEWAWTKVNLANLQNNRQAAAPSEIEAAIKAYRHALRKKKALDAANPAKIPVDESQDVA